VSSAREHRHREPSLHGIQTQFPTLMRRKFVGDLWAMQLGMTNHDQKDGLENRVIPRLSSPFT
jgi:hypothetical protein